MWDWISDAGTPAGLVAKLMIYGAALLFMAWCFIGGAATILWLLSLPFQAIYHMVTWIHGLPAAMTRKQAARAAVIAEAEAINAAELEANRVAEQQAAITDRTLSLIKMENELRLALEGTRTGCGRTPESRAEAAIKVSAIYNNLTAARKSLR